MTKTTTERVPRQVVADQLLIALNDKSKVAYVMDADDLQVLIFCVGYAPASVEARRLTEDLLLLQKSAFGEEPSQ